MYQNLLFGLFFWEPDNQKNPRVRKIRVRNSGAGNGCVNFMDAWKNAFFLQGKTHVHKIPRFRGGGGILGFWGGGGVPILFLWARGLSWVFLEWGHRNQHRTTNVGPFKCNMISHIFFCKGEMFLRMFQIEHDVPHPLCKREVLPRKCQIILEMISQIIFEIIFAKFGMLCSSCRAQHVATKRPYGKHPRLF